MFHLRLCLPRSLFPLVFPASFAPSTVHELQVLFTFCYKPHFHFPLLKSLHIIRSFGSLCICFNMLIFTLRGFLPPRPIPKQDDHPLSALSNCLFSIFAAALHIWRPFPPSKNYFFKSISSLQAFSPKYIYNSFISLSCYMSCSSHPLVYARGNIYCKSL